ncbi:MAG: YihY/virulence factor BrkB family protein [Cytophagaceae bacterium]
MNFSRLAKIFKQAINKWIDDDAYDLSAVVAYYAIFSLPALIIIIVTIAGSVFGEKAVEGRISEEIGNLIGTEAASQIQTMVANAYTRENSTLAAIVGISILIFGATGVFAALKRTLNKIWEVIPDPNKSGIIKFILDRTTSFGVVLSLGFLMLISLVISTALSFFSDWLRQFIPDFLLIIFMILNFIMSFIIISVIFALMFKYLPDVKIQWKSVWPGAILTTVLFLIGKYAINLYFTNANPTTTFGAAGSIVLIMLWVTYSSLIFFFGAEFTRAYALENNHIINTTSHSVFIKKVDC